MKLALGRGKILRIRPGHLANFSGGAGYMPFVIFFSAPVSFMFGLVGSLSLYFMDKASDPDGSASAAARTKALLVAPDTGCHRKRRTSLYDLADHGDWHLLICAVLTIVAGTLFFFMALSAVYGSKSQYAIGALLIGAGPFVAWFFSTWMLVRWTYRSGARVANLLLAGLTHLALIIICFMVAIFVSLG
jgi:hypothetical protein